MTKRLITAATAAPALLLAIVANAAVAQFPIGQATAASGYAPALFSEPLWLGNLLYGYRIEHAPPGGPVLVAVATNRLDQTLPGGLQVFIDLPAIFVVHPGVADATGRAFLPIPLGVPDVPALCGLDLYAQAGALDPVGGALSVTQGLLLEISARPLIAYSAWPGVLWLVDPVGVAITQVGGLPANANPQGGVFGGGGRDLYFATDAGLFLVDTFAPSPVAALLALGNWRWLAWDRVHDVLYGLNQLSGQLVVFDGNRASVSFGSVITQVPSVASAFSQSADGKIGVFIAGFGTVTRRDTDPTSPTYLQFVPTTTPPGTAFGPLATQIHMSPDGRVVSVPAPGVVPFPTMAIHRFDGLVGSGVWIDHDPVAGGYQPLAALSFPTLPPDFRFWPTRDGSAAYCIGSQTVHRIDLDPSQPDAITPVATQVVPSNLVGLDPSGRFFVQAVHNTTSIPPTVDLALVGTTLGDTYPLVTLPGGLTFAPASVAVWR